MLQTVARSAKLCFNVIIRTNYGEETDGHHHEEQDPALGTRARGLAVVRVIRSTLGRGLAEARDLYRGLDRDDLLVVLARALFEASPAVRQHLSDLVVGELKEEIGKDDTSYAFGVIRLIEEIVDEWRNERG
jgi:hypothetical protein